MKKISYSSPEVTVTILETSGSLLTGSMDSSTGSSLEEYVDMGDIIIWPTL